MEEHKGGVKAIRCELSTVPVAASQYPIMLHLTKEGQGYLVLVVGLNHTYKLLVLLM